MAEADVVVVGSGATGSLLAARLGAAGRKVVVLEGGPPRRLERMYSSTIWSRDLKWAGPPARVAGKNPVTFPFEAGWGQGGSALHHYACWFRLHEEDFKFATINGIGFDWPIEYRDLQPYYDTLQKEVGLSGDKDREIWRPPGEPYPMPPQPVFRQAQLLAEGFAKRGMHTAPLPMAINSVPYNGRPACLQDGWCDAGCPTGALANPIVIFGKAMKKAGVETRYNAFVSRILTTPSGRRANSVEYFEADGTKKTIDAKLVILAAFAVQTPRILLNSADDRHPNGLANSSGCVGRYFTPHAAVNLYGMFSEETEVHMGRTGGQLMCQDDYSSDPARGFIGGYTWRIGAALKLADLGGLANARVDLFGERLKMFMERASRHLATMSALIANQPSFENGITLTSEKDKNGIPLARLNNTLSADAIKAAQGAIKQGLDIFKAAGAAEAWAASLRTEHMMGGTLMGEDPARSVTDSFGRTHDVDNLFIAGTGLMPTVGAVNPTFTASALAARTAEHIIDNWATFEAS
ncbi:MAG TPA: GMC family oxidoreductase [Rhizomicrobium sp.]|nr:GMC family oxidoreductase [Rhizomicrobium sp.]